MDTIQVVAGSVAGLIFAAGSLEMLIKAWQTKDLHSYSLSQLLLNNVGNLFYWLYVVSLPLGPIYFMQGFFTLVSLVMLAWYFIYDPAPANGTDREVVLKGRVLFPRAHRMNPLPATCVW